MVTNIKINIINMENTKYYHITDIIYMYTHTHTYTHIHTHTRAHIYIYIYIYIYYNKYIILKKILWYMRVFFNLVLNFLIKLNIYIHM